MRRVLLSLALLLTIGATCASAQTVYRVSSGTHWFGGSGVNEAVTLAGIGTGDCIGILSGWDNASTITSVAGNSNTYTPVDTRTDGTAGSLASYYVKNASSGSTTITITWSADPGAGGMAAFAYSNCDTTAPLDVHTTALQVNPLGGITTGSVTTTANGDAIVAYAEDDTGSILLTLGTGFGNLTETSTWSEGEDRIQTSAGAIAGSFGPASQQFGRVLSGVLTFRAAAGTGSADCGHLLGVWRCDEASR